MSKKEKYNVKGNSKQAGLKWDDLVPLYNDTSASLQGGIKALEEVGETFQEIIDGDKEIAKVHIGLASTYADLTGELTGILKLHSKPFKTEDDESVEYRPYTGKVIDDEKHQEGYLFIVMAYGGLNDKIVSIVENTTVTLLGIINEKIKHLEKLNDAAIKDAEYGK